MVSRWQKLNYLVPDPRCRMGTDGAGKLQIVEWKDERAQPSDADIDNVSEEDAEAQFLDEELVAELYATKFNKVLIEVIFSLENRLRILEGENSVTREQIVTHLKDLYKEV